MKKRIKYVAALLALCAMLTGCGANSYAPVLKANWGLKLPARAECRETYEADSGASFQGDGLRYHVYACEDIEALANAVDAWAERAGQNADGSQLAESAEEYLTELAVPAEERPDPASCLFWFKAGQDDSRDQILLLLDGEAGRLYVIELFM